MGRYNPLSLVILIIVAAPLARAEEEPAACERVRSIQSRIDALDRELGRLRDSSDPTANTRRTKAEEDKRKAEDEKRTKELDCNTHKNEAERLRLECKKRDDKLWKWNPNAGTFGRCEDQAENVKANKNEGECSNAELFKGTNLRGEACKAAESTIKDVKAQQEGIVAATGAAATAYSGMQAMQANGQQADAQERQRKILQTLAIAKLTTGGLQLAGAAQLKNAAGDAEGAHSNISKAHRALSDYCDDDKNLKDPKNTSVTISREQCFNANAKQYGVNDVTYATFERMMSGASQSKEQADKANAMAKMNLVTGMADTLVGIQALMASRQAAQNVGAMGAPPLMQALPPGRLAATGQGGLAPGAVPGETPAGPTDYGMPGGGDLGLGGGSGKIGNSIKSGKGFATSGYKAEKSTVSTSGGGGGGGGGGRGGGGGSGSSRKGSASNTTGGEYNLGGGGAGFRGGAGEGKNDGSNAFADALAKLFPQDQNGKPVVDSRNLASGPEEVTDPDAFIGSGVEATDLSIFEQVNAKYRQLSNAGQI